ncbi:MAG: radical SAM family heme chaperone HemW [Balneolaceae bacterium]
MNGIYIHIPFCKQACSYCDFYFVTQLKLRPAFLEALVSEIKFRGRFLNNGEIFDTIYIGGGTPSLLAAGDIERILQTLNRELHLDLKEITIEMNPDDVTEGYLKELKQLGIDRVSLGVQSFNSKLLTFMHRAHNPEQAVYALETIQKTGFKTYTADLIYGNPNQTIDDLESDIKRLLEFDPPHISAYSLTIEPNTRLGKQVELGRLIPPDEDTVSDHFKCIQATLASHGIRQYEVSNYALPGHEALHNSNYWNHHNYLGFGPAAHSFWWDTKDKARRWQNRRDLKEYLKQDFSQITDEVEILDLHQLAEERIMLGLRTTEGVSVPDLKKIYGYSLSKPQLMWIQKQHDQYLLKGKSDRIHVTSQGIGIADYLVVELLSRH